MRNADFTGDKKQSRSTLALLGLYEGSDKGLMLREYSDIVLLTWKELMIAKKLRLADDVKVPCRPITSADMQGSKSLYGMTTSHSEWCFCNRKQQHLCCIISHTVRQASRAASASPRSSASAAPTRQQRSSGRTWPT
eukprot:5347674-Pleurochrysis_carterae.AAC.1